jgi:hypothetical protein
MIVIIFKFKIDDQTIVKSIVSGIKCMGRAQKYALENIATDEGGARSEELNCFSLLVIAIGPLTTSTSRVIKKKFKRNRNFQIARKKERKERKTEKNENHWMRCPSALIPTRILTRLDAYSLFRWNAAERLDRRTYSPPDHDSCQWNAPTTHAETAVLSGQQMLRNYSSRTAM